MRIQSIDGRKPGIVECIWYRKPGVIDVDGLGIVEIGVCLDGGVNSTLVVLWWCR